nr:hypothetical protein [Tanacetum cinerariifolium]
MFELLSLLVLPILSPAHHKHKTYNCIALWEDLAYQIDNKDTKKQGVPNEQQRKTFGTDEGTDDEGNDDGDDTDNNDDDNDEHEEEEENVVEFTYKEDDDENEEESDDGKELYKDVNVNLRQENVEMTDVDQGGADLYNVSQESRFEQKERCSSDNEIASLIDTIVHTEEPSVSDFATPVIEQNVTESLEVVVLARSRDNKDKDQDPSTVSDKVTKRRNSSKEANKSAHVEEPSHTVDDSEVQKNQEYDMGNNNDQPEDETTLKNECVTTRAKKPPTSFDDLMDTLIDFFTFVMNRLNITNLTQELLVRPAFNLLKGTCKSLTKLEYHFKECSKATAERLDWHNPKGKQNPFDLRKHIPLIPDHRGRQVIPQDYFINNEMEYLKGGRLSKQYSTFVTKT